MHLTFIETTNTEGFKRIMNCTKVQVIANPKKDGSHFIAIDSDPSFRGAISGSIDEVMANPTFSLVKGDDGREFWMLYKKQFNNVVAEL